MNIRAATLDDAPEVARLSAQFAAYLASLGDSSPGPLTEEAYRRDGFGASPRFSGLVAECEDRVCGYLLHHPGYDVDLCAPITLIVDLFVDPAARRQGVGRRLMDAAAAAARRAGSAELVWTVYRANRIACEFYESIGAEHVGDLTLMRLRL